MEVTANFVNSLPIVRIIIIIIIKNEKIRVTLCENAAGALYIVNKHQLDISEPLILVR